MVTEMLNLTECFYSHASEIKSPLEKGETPGGWLPFPHPLLVSNMETILSQTTWV